MFVAKLLRRPHFDQLLRSFEVGPQQKVGIWPPYRYEGFTNFCKGKDRAKASTLVQDRQTRPLIDALL